MNPWRSAGRAAFPLTLRTGDIERELTVDLDAGGATTVTVDDAALAVRVLGRDGAEVRVLVGDVQETVHAAIVGERLYLDVRGVQAEFVEPPPKGAAPEVDAGGDGTLLAPTSGRVVAVHVEVGDRVRRGQVLVTLEAMKIENALAVAIAGVVTEVKVKPGDQVPQGRLLAVVEPDDGPEPGAASAAA